MGKYNSILYNCADINMYSYKYCISFHKALPVQRFYSYNILFPTKIHYTLYMKSNPFTIYF